MLFYPSIMHFNYYNLYLLLLFFFFFYNFILKFFFLKCDWNRAIRIYKPWVIQNNCTTKKLVVGCSQNLVSVFILAFLFVFSAFYLLGNHGFLRFSNWFSCNVNFFSNAKFKLWAVWVLEILTNYFISHFEVSSSRVHVTCTMWVCIRIKTHLGLISFLTSHSTYVLGLNGISWKPQ